MHVWIIQASAGYLTGKKFDPQRILGGWKEKLDCALAKGYAGLRVSGKAFWFEANLWRDFCAYERDISRALAKQKVLALSTYPLKESQAVDVLNVARAHHVTIARRYGEWEFLAATELAQHKPEINEARGGIDIVSNPFPGSDLLTPQERVVLAQLLKGGTSKEVGRVLSLSPRTIDFHRADIMRRLGARNMADLVRKILSD